MGVRWLNPNKAIGVWGRAGALMKHREPAVNLVPASFSFCVPRVLEPDLGSCQGKGVPDDRNKRPKPVFTPLTRA